MGENLNLGTFLTRVLGEYPHRMSNSEARRQLIATFSSNLHSFASDAQIPKTMNKLK